MREGDNMMKNVIRMLGQTSEIIYESGVDCTPYPNGNVSLAENLENRNEYGSNSEFIPTEEKDISATLNRAPFRDDSRRKRKRENPLTTGSGGAESKKDSIPNTQQNRDRYFRHPQPNFMGHDYDKENVNAQKLISRGYQERTFSEERACNDYQAKWNAVRYKPKTVTSSGLQERNVSQKYNLSSSITRSDLQTDFELKMKWTRKKPSTLINGNLPISISNGKSWRPSTLKPDMENHYKWTPAKLLRLQERIRVREKLKSFFAMTRKDKQYGVKGKHCSSGHAK